jgi:hypothetical protein
VHEEKLKGSMGAFWRLSGSMPAFAGIVIGWFTTICSGEDASSQWDEAGFYIKRKEVMAGKRLLSLPRVLGTVRQSLIQPTKTNYEKNITYSGSNSDAWGVM